MLSLNLKRPKICNSTYSPPPLGARFPFKDVGRGSDNVVNVARLKQICSSPSHGDELANASMNLTPSGRDDMDKEKENEGTNDIVKDTVICGTLSEHTEHFHHNWVRPPVEKEFSYPSDEEILPNPKASFSKNVLHLDKVRQWFKSSGRDKSDKDAPSSSAAPCLPISDAPSPSEDSQYSRPYVKLGSRLPQDPILLQQYQERQGMATRLRSIASQRVGNNSTHTKVHESDDSDRDSSSSLERLSESPRYSEFARSMVADEECELEDENIILAHVCNIPNFSKI